MTPNYQQLSLPGFLLASQALSIRDVFSSQRYTPGERELLRAVAAKQGTPPTMWIRSAALIEARRIARLEAEKLKLNPPTAQK